VPQLGLVRTSVLVGMINALVGLWGTWFLRPLLDRNPTGLARPRRRPCLLVLGGVLIEAEWLTQWSEEHIFDGEVMYSRTTRRISASS